MALEETILFLIDTAFIQEQDQPITLTFTPRADGLMVQITVQGLPMDIHRLPSFSPENLLDDGQLNSLSLHLARNFMDTIEFTNHGRAGIIVKLLKRLSSSHISRRIKESSQKTSTTQEVQAEKNCFSDCALFLRLFPEDVKTILYSQASNQMPLQVEMRLFYSISILPGILLKG